jgi:hypothetical protein
VEYLGHRQLEVRGATGRTYRFSPEVRAQAVDRRDLAGLLRSKLFRQVPDQLRLTSEA